MDLEHFFPVDFDYAFFIHRKIDGFCLVISQRSLTFRQGIASGGQLYGLGGSIRGPFDFRDGVPVRICPADAQLSPRQFLRLAQNGLGDGNLKGFQGVFHMDLGDFFTLHLDLTVFSYRKADGFCLVISQRRLAFR